MITDRERYLLGDALKFYAPDGADASISFSSTIGEAKINFNIRYTPCFGSLASIYHNYPDNLGFKLYQQDKTGKVCLILIHGYNSKNKRTYEQLAHRFSARGMDSLVYVLPLHFERMVDYSVLKTPHFTHIFEIYRQAVIELRLLVRYLKGQGYNRVGCLGFSFGGYCCSLLACFEKNTDFIIPMASLGDLGPILRYLEKNLKLEAEKFPLSGTGRLNQYLIQNHLSLISPINFKPLIPKESMLFIQGLLDGRAPVSDVQKFRKKWGGPRVVWYPCDHFTFILFNRITTNIAASFIKGL